MIIAVILVNDHYSMVVDDHFPCMIILKHCEPVQLLVADEKRPTRWEPWPCRCLRQRLALKNSRHAAIGTGWVEDKCGDTQRL